MNNQKYNIDYPIENGIMYCSINLNTVLNGDDIDKINSLSSEIFYIEISDLEKNTIINIHKKAIL